MVTNILVDDQFEEGKKLIEELDSQKLSFPIALWVNFEEQNGWTLLFSVNKLKEIGSKNIFLKIQQVIIKKQINISLSDITLLDDHDDFCQDLRKMIKTDLSLGKIVFTGNSINGKRFPDSIIYRSN